MNWEQLRQQFRHAAQSPVGVRVVLAVKAAVAGALAWIVATYLPGDTQTYGYYAPTGAIVCMYSTLAAATFTAARTAAGLAAGAVLTYPMVLNVEPSFWSMGLLVLVGMLLAGWTVLGAGGPWVPMTAVTVLALGQPDPSNYPLYYVLYIAVGAAIAIAVNLLTVPMLYVDAAVRRLAGVRQELVGALRRQAHALEQEWPPPQEWWQESRDLDALARQAREAIDDARDSTRGNPWVHNQSRDLTQDFADLQAMNEVTRYVRDIGEVLHTCEHRETWPGFPADLRPVTAQSLRDLANLLDAWSSDEAVDAADRARSSLRDYHRSIDEYGGSVGWDLVAPLSVASNCDRALQTVIGRIGEHPETAWDDAREPS